MDASGAQRAALNLVEIDASNWRDALGVRVRPDQLRFVADYQPVALVSLAKSYVRPGGLHWVPLGIANGGDIIGLVTLAYSVPEPTECELLHLVLDQHWQGKGLGRAAMQMILDHIRRTMPTCRGVMLTVDSDNVIARRLYEPLGFHPTGLERAGDPLLRLAL